VVDEVVRVNEVEEEQEQSVRDTVIEEKKQGEVEEEKA